MHLPDGFIDGKTAATAAALSAVGVGIALRRVRRQMPARKVPLLGLMAAFLFAAQMVNFPVAGGTSGHLIGGVLAASLLGPSAAVVAVTTVLIVQCFLFADGGVLALGANVLNMAIINPAAGYAIYRLVCWKMPGIRGRVTAVAFGGWCATVLAALSCAGQLAWSRTISWGAGFTAMAGVHMLIGVGEGLISALVLLAIHRTRPEMIVETSLSRPQRWADLTCYGLLGALGLALFVAPFACSWPDGLESVAARFGIHAQTVGVIWPAPAPNYQPRGMPWGMAATAVGGTVGALIAFGLALLLGWVLVPAKKGVKPT